MLGSIGSGGQAVVYRVRHRTLGTLHALKVVQHTSASVRARLLDEGRVQATLRHPNVVNVTDVVDVDGQPGLIMEFVVGPPLNLLLERHRLSLDQVEPLALGILEGVAHAHRKGFVHRDLKPHNILCAIQEDGELVPKILDFGLVKALDAGGHAGRTRTGQFMGTAHYMAPEQIRDTKGVDQRADVWAVGVIFYQMLTGELPFDGHDMFEIFRAVTTGEYIDPRERVPDLPERMRNAIERSLQVDLDRRVTSCERLLRIWRGEAPLSESHPPAPTRISARWADLNLETFAGDQGTPETTDADTGTMDHALSDPGTSLGDAAPTLSPAIADMSTAQVQPLAAAPPVGITRMQSSTLYGSVGGGFSEEPTAQIQRSLLSLPPELDEAIAPIPPPTLPPATATPPPAGVGRWIAVAGFAMFGLMMFFGIGAVGVYTLGVGGEEQSPAPPASPVAVSGLLYTDTPTGTPTGPDLLDGDPNTGAPGDDGPIPGPVPPSPKPPQDRSKRGGGGSGSGSTPTGAPVPPGGGNASDGDDGGTPTGGPQEAVPVPPPAPDPEPVLAPKTTATVGLAAGGDAESGYLCCAGTEKIYLWPGKTSEVPPGTYTLKIGAGDKVITAKTDEPISVSTGDVRLYTCSFSSAHCRLATP